MKKRIFALALALLMGITLLAACGGKTPEPEPAAPGTDAPSTAEPATPDEPAAPDLVTGNGETLKVMLMPSGSIDDSMQKKVTEAINEILMAELNFKVEFVMSGPAWNFEDQVNAMQTGTSDIDIFPAHSWSGITYPMGAANGQWVRLDNAEGEFGDLLSLYGENIYKGASDSLMAAANIPGAEGPGIYGMLIEKDLVQEIGFLANNDLLAKYDLSDKDFDPQDFANWGENLKKIKDGEGSNFFPLNIEAEVLDRMLNNIAFVGDTKDSLGIVFDYNNPEGTDVKIVSRYQTDAYRELITIVNEYYQAGFVDPGLGIQDTAPETFTAAKDKGNYALSTFSYAPGAEKAEAARTGMDIVWVPGWKEPIGFTEQSMGAGLAVYAGSKNVELAVQFLNFINTNKEFADLLAAGIEGECYEPNGDGSISYIPDTDRGGWNIWRYGVVGTLSPATPMDTPDEWTNFTNFNKSGATLPSTGFLFDPAPVDQYYSACNAVISKYAVPFGSGAQDVSNLDGFLTELEGAGIDKVVEEANAQYEAWKAAS